MVPGLGIEPRTRGFSIHGDIPAVERELHPDKSEQEKAALLHLTHSLGEKQRKEILSLWQEYEHAVSPESRIVKALDKLETILQHNQGINPPDFDYEFNLTYGLEYTSTHPLFILMREILNADTRQKIAERAQL
ncbi:HD domain-containing protein [Salmonella enterica]|uniref:HD domain-containing protein n=1 Tax=Salmonella enterica TaxID=28901 RepID=UPI0003BC69F3|nr:HD domain-containing protein [Salmonella enterica]ESJ13024.1 hypothetical protein SED60170_26626 [Salmonella enterica subsp. diarizonae serovar 60:r:e,n,x,z15 str. 01-0170]